MKICAIKDESQTFECIIGYLLYYEKTKDFCIELSPNLHEAEAPIMFGLFLQKGIQSIGPEWSRRWVEARIVPRDRQNLGMVLKANGLMEYDTYKLLMLGQGRCAQDDCCLLPVSEKMIPSWLGLRLTRKLKSAVPLHGTDMVVTFVDGTVRYINLEEYIRETPALSVLINYSYRLHTMSLMSGGSGVTWGQGLSISAEELYTCGSLLPFSADDIRTLIPALVMDTSEACAYLSCSRQYVDKLVREGELPVIKEGPRMRLYMRADVERILKD